MATCLILNGERLGGDPPGIERIPANALVDIAAGQGGWWRAWGTYMQERYMLPTIATSL